MRIRMLGDTVCPGLWIADLSAARVEKARLNMDVGLQLWTEWCAFDSEGCYCGARD